MNRELLIKKGLAKYDMFENEFKTFFFRSILAGLYLGVAVCFSYSIGAMLDGYIPAGVVKILIGITFGIGLVSIYMLGGDLFTGNCFSGVLSVFAKKTKVIQMIKMLTVCYVANFIGLFIVCFLFVNSGVNKEYIGKYFVELMEYKEAIPYMELLIRAILANFVVCMGSLAMSLIKSESAKIITIILLVAAFIIPGYEHSIANMGIFTIGVHFVDGGLSWIPLNMVFATLGNIIGGSILFAVPVWFMTKVDSH